jgi:DNA-directed RNA polymerase specialized sigma24 family protein
MSFPGSVTGWIDLLRAGDRAAVQPLWREYFQRLVALAREMIRRAPRGMADEEDVALSAFDSFVRGAEQGRFPNLADRDDLWRLLLVITERKAVDLVNHELRARRGGGKVRNEASLASSSSVSPALDRFAHSEPTPELAAVLAEECRRLLDVLNDATLRAVAVAKMEGYTNEEIADRLEVALPTVERKLQRIRRIWDKEKPQ